MLAVIVCLAFGIGSGFLGGRGVMYGILSFAAFLALPLTVGLYQETSHTVNRVAYLMAFCLMLFMGCFLGALSLDSASKGHPKSTTQEKGNESKHQVQTVGDPESPKVTHVAPTVHRSPQQVRHHPPLASQPFKEIGSNTDKGTQKSNQKGHTQAKSFKQTDKKPLTTSKNVIVIPTPTFILEADYPENQ